MARRADRPIPLNKYAIGIVGLLHRKEADFLHTTPDRLGDGLYGDLGTFCGRSAACVAGGMLDNNVDGHIITVDHYIKRKPKSKWDNVHRTTETIRQTFEDKGLGSYVTVVNSRTAEAAADYQDKEFVFIFIDADHLYEGCKADFEAWSPLVRSGGEIAFHDSNQSDVKRVIEESGWEVVDRIYTIEVIKKP